MLGRHMAPWLILAVTIAGIAGCSGDRTGSQSAAEEAATAAPPAALESATTPTGSISATALLETLHDPQSPAILDVRSQKEYDEGHIPGAIHVPYDQIPQRLGELEAYRDRGLVVYCRTGRRAGIAEEALAQAGFERVWDLEGHMVQWREADYPLAVPALN